MYRLAASIALLLAGASLALATTEERGLPVQPSGERPSVRVPEYTPACSGDAHACLHKARAMRPPDTSRRRLSKPRAVPVKAQPPTTSQRGVVVKHGNGSNPTPVANHP